MTKHTCKHCNRIFEYCRGCLLSPIPHMDAGFCSKECYEASKINVVSVVIEAPVAVEPEIIEEVVVVETAAPIVEEAPAVVEDVAVEAEAVIEAVVPIEEPVAEATPKKETNVYKKKKNKH